MKEVKRQVDKDEADTRERLRRRVYSAFFFFFLMLHCEYYSYALISRRPRFVAKAALRN
jgi:hypothetical protein